MRATYHTSNPSTLPAEPHPDVAGVALRPTPLGTGPAPSAVRRPLG